jgi:hypothetical protein
VAHARVDVEGILATLSAQEGGRSRPWLPGLRPVHEVRPGTFTSGEHTYPTDNVQPGSTSPVALRFFFPEVVEGALWVGKTLRVQEGARVTGHLTITHIHNAAMDRRRAPPEPFHPGSFDGLRWATAAGAYGTPYDPRPSIARIAAGRDVDLMWAKLWQELHHQGDIGSASLLALPALADLRDATGVPDWNVHALATAVEAARLQRRVPHPEGLHESYYTNGLEALTRLALEDLSLTDEPLVVRSALVVIAFGRGQPLRGRLMAELTDDEIEEVLKGRSITSPGTSG